jgi:hypothetical protein
VNERADVTAAVEGIDDQIEAVGDEAEAGEELEEIGRTGLKGVLEHAHEFWSGRLLLPPNGKATTSARLNYFTQFTQGWPKAPTLGFVAQPR